MGDKAVEISDGGKTTSRQDGRARRMSKRDFGQSRYQYQSATTRFRQKKFFVDDFESQCRNYSLTSGFPSELCFLNTRLTVVEEPTPIEFPYVICWPRLSAPLVLGFMLWMIFISLHLPRLGANS